MQWGTGGLGYGTGFLTGQGLGLFLVVVAWSLFWKGLALWHSARRGQNVWFIVLLVLNTAGILEIIYLFAVAGIKWRELFGKNEEKTQV